MLFTSLNRIISAKDYGGSARGYIRKHQQDLHRNRGIAVTIVDLDKDPIGAPVLGKIWVGQWIASCECNTDAFVDPDEPIYFCFGCLNRRNGDRPRPVIFPPTEERLEIERLLLQRPVDDIRGLTDMERAGLARPLLYKQVVMPDGSVAALSLVRSWEPSQTIADLRAEQDLPISAWLESLQTGPDTGAANVVQ